jgi:hypothetical protein
LSGDLLELRQKSQFIFLGRKDESFKQLIDPDTRTMLIFLTIITIILLLLGAWRWADHNADNRAWTRLALHQPSEPRLFDPSMVDGLPDPARRFFRFAIRPETPLYTVAEITMEGEFGLGSKAEQNYLPMHAEQILAAPHGFVWKLHAGNRLVRISGSDVAQNANSWSRFWLLGIVPVARTGGSADHIRSAFGRYIAEAVLWTPAALLPSQYVQWDPIDNSTVRVTVTHMELEQAVDLSVDSNGKLSKIVFQRWSDANALKAFQLQPFGGYLSEYRDFDGFCLPTKIEAGNFFETEEYFAFFRVNVTRIRFPSTNGDRPASALQIPKRGSNCP